MRFILKKKFSGEICIIFYVDLLQGHISIVRNLKDISTEKCTEDNCCGNKRHCLLCFKEKFKPTYLKKIQMHHYSHWNRRIHYKGNLQYIYTCIANIEGVVMNVIDAVCLTEKQQLYRLVSPDQGLIPQSTAFKTSTRTITPSMQFLFLLLVPAMIQQKKQSPSHLSKLQYLISYWSSFTCKLLYFLTTNIT